MSGFNPQDTRTFETKVANLIAATRHLDVSKILTLRRLTLQDPETRKWASEKQLNVVFSVILTKAIERFGLDTFRDARERQFKTMLPTGAAGHPDDLKILADLAMQMLGPPVLSEAETTQAGFEALLARGAGGSSPPKVARAQSPTKEPAPLFAAQLGPAPAKPASAPDHGGTPAAAAVVVAEPAVPKAFVDFNTLFDDTLCAYARKVLTQFHIASPSQGIRIPFLLAPEFCESYEAVLRKFVLPVMRTSRHLQTVGSNHNWAEVGGEKIIEIMQAGEINNPILHNWDVRWGMFRLPRNPVKGKKPVLRPEDNPWPMFRQDATRYGYEPPSEANIPLLQDVLRFEADAIARCWREMGQLYEQEFSPSSRQDQGRDGSFRDGIIKWSQRLPDHVGEHLAIKAYFEFPKVDDYFVRRLLNNFGKNDTERSRLAPFLNSLVQQLGE